MAEQKGAIGRLKGGDAMDAGRNDLLGELAADAALERKDFLVQAARQLDRFLDANADRISELGGMTLIDDDPDYLSVAPDLTFRSRSRYLDDSGKWVNETEVVESAAELVELYNLADVFQAFAEAAREAAGLAPEPTAAAEMLDTAGIGPEETFGPSGADVYAAAADEWAAGQPVPLEADDEEVAARQMYDLALEYQERSQRAESRLLDLFEATATNLSAKLGDLVIVEDDDERLTLEAGGTFRAEVMPEGSEGAWRTLGTAEELVEFYDPTDVFGDLADALAEAYPGVVGQDGAPDGDTGGEGGALDAGDTAAEGVADGADQEVAPEDGTTEAPVWKGPAPQGSADAGGTDEGDHRA